MGANASTDREGVPRPSAQSTSITTSTSASASAEVCPIDHQSREAWLEQARKTGQGPPIPHPLPPSSSPTSPRPIPAGESCDSSQMDQSIRSPGLLRSRLGLGTDREISTIPRATSTPSDGPANNEVESGKDKSGNWVYPSEQMFFDAMKRKNYDPQARDMQSIVPIHNAVNERAWKEILDWEKGRGSEKCGGPKLVSFSGQATALTPKARFNSILGYTAPFDRHDWVVDRCGTRVEYVIDFYSGRDEGKVGKSLNFYLDVRPKLNTWEGVRMRAANLVGL